MTQGTAAEGPDLIFGSVRKETTSRGARTTVVAPLPGRRPEGWKRNLAPRRDPGS